jgi:hypothetical protein
MYMPWGIAVEATLAQTDFSPCRCGDATGLTEYAYALLRCLQTDARRLFGVNRSIFIEKMATRLTLEIVGEGGVV